MGLLIFNYATRPVKFNFFISRINNTVWMYKVMLSGILQHMVIHVLSLEVLCECHFQADNNVTLTFEILNVK